MVDIHAHRDKPAMFVRSALPKGHPYHDFRNFLKDVWDHLGLPEPTPEQYDMAYWLQHGPKRSISEAFRGFGKSFITAAFACWCWMHDVNYRILVVSGGGARATAFSRFALNLLRMMPELSHLAPGRNQLSNNLTFEVAGSVNDQTPSCKSIGINGQLTGSRADLIIADDVETPANSMTAGQREKLATLVTEFDALLKPNDNARISYLGTPQNEDSLYNGLEEKGYVCRIWPARMPSATATAQKYGERLAPYIRDLDLPEGAPISSRFGEQDLLERAASYGASGFALQFMLDTSLDDELKYPLKCRDLIVMSVDRDTAPIKTVYGSSPDLLEDIQCRGMKGDRFYRPMYVSEAWSEYDGKMMFIDPAGRGADKTAFAVVNNIRGQLHVRRIGSAPGGYDDTALETLAHVARIEGVNCIRIESNFGDGMFTQLFRPVLARIYPVEVDEIHHTKQKELRIIDTLEPLLNQHRLVFDKNILVKDLQEENTHSLVHQLTRVCKERGALAHDDALDALAGACAYWVEHLGIDTQNVETDFKREKLDETLDQWLDETLGRSTSLRAGSSHFDTRNKR